MAKSSNQKLKLLYIARILSQQTDEQHGITVRELISQLNSYEIRADRKTIYQDLEELRLFGMDIVSVQAGRNTYYHLASRDFQLPELKLLVDSVQSSKFITERKSRELIKKLEALVSVHEAKQLHRQVILTGRVKTMNESIYYSIDKIHNAINEDRQIKFQYFQWNIKKEMELRHQGAWYEISPWALVWNDEYYYLIGFDHTNEIMKHFRVDKMLHIKISGEKRQGKRVFLRLDLPQYSKALFGMFGGDMLDVSLLCENALAGAIIDRFGKEPSLIPVDKDHFQVTVKVSPSQQFIGWVIGLGSGIKVIGPESLISSIKAQCKRLLAQYE